MAIQNKKRKYNREREDRDDRDRTPEEPEDPLKDATTLYVGNLCGWQSSFVFGTSLIAFRSFYTTEEQIHELFAKWEIEWSHSDA